VRRKGARVSCTVDRNIFYKINRVSEIVTTVKRGTYPPIKLS
jgi:hypothetical protein